MATALTIQTARPTHLAQRSFEPRAAATERANRTSHASQTSQTSQASQFSQNDPSIAVSALKTQPTSKDQASNDDKFTFGDFIDVINPLQHLPVVGTLYRHFTGDEISSSSRIAGSTLFGGPLGFVLGAANAFVDNLTGRDVGEHVMAFAGLGKTAKSAEPETPEAPIHMDMLAKTPSTTPSQTLAPFSAPVSTSSTLPLGNTPVLGKVVNASELFRARPANLSQPLFAPPSGSRAAAPTRAAHHEPVTLPLGNLTAKHSNTEETREDGSRDQTERLPIRAEGPLSPALNAVPPQINPQNPIQDLPGDFLYRLQSSMSAYERSRDTNNNTMPTDD